ncbi:MAG: choice-of-anchor J domain-containing protein [Planctomycetota bacterium]
MKRSLIALLCLGLADAAAAQVLTEDFDGGVFPPPGWTVADNTGNGPWLLNTDYGRTNYTGGSGACAAIDGDLIGWGALDTELITPSFAVPAGSTLEFDHSFRWYSGGLNEQGDVDISVAGGAWTLLQNFSGGSDGYPTGVHRSIDLGAYAGSNVQIRFRYYDTNWDWWWQVDNVVITGPPASATSRNAGTNPASHTAVTLPVLGATYTATVDLGGTTGHNLAWLVGYSTPITLPLGGGQTLLANVADPNGELLLQPFLAGPVATYNLPVPVDVAFAGVAASTQALHIGGVQPWALSNAQDLVLGY